MRIVTGIIVLSISLLAGCQTRETWTGGHNELIELNWQEQIKTNKTTEKELVKLLGQPNGYYHHTPNNGERYMLYQTTLTTCTRYHLPLMPALQICSHCEGSDVKAWFYISDGIVTKKLESCKNPDLSNYILSPDPEYPHCSKVKCSLERQKKVSNQ